MIIDSKATEKVRVLIDHAIRQKSGLNPATSEEIMVQEFVKMMEVVNVIPLTKFWGEFFHKI